MPNIHSILLRPCGRAGIVVLYDGEPGPGAFAVGIEDQKIELGVIRLPNSIGPLGAVTVDQLVSVAVGSWSFMDRADHGRIERFHDPAHCRVWRDRMALGMEPEHIYTDHGLTGRTRARPGLDQALAAVRKGDTLVVTKLDRLARSAPDARTIADGLAERSIRLALGAMVHDPTDPMGKMFFNRLATFAEFDSDLIRMRTRE